MMRLSTITIRCLEGNERSWKRDTHTEQKDDPEERVEKVFRCVLCATELAPLKAVFHKNSDHLVQAHANPYGYIHEILTLREAHHLVFIGSPTTEFTWFPGYAWQIAHCGGCGTHVGWRYTATLDVCAPLVFFGLLRKAITEA